MLGQKKISKVYDGHVNVSESGKWFDSGLDASYERIVDELDAAGVDRAALLAMPGVCTNAIFSSSKVDRNRFWCFGNLTFLSTVFLDCSYYLQAFRGTSLESDFYSLLKTVDRKVIYGSDFPEVSAKSYLEDFVRNASVLEDTKMDNIVHRNLESLMGRKACES